LLASYTLNYLLIYEKNQNRKLQEQDSHFLKY